MDILKRILRSVGHFLLSIARVLQQAICCRRRREPEYLLPLTINQVSGSHKTSDMYEFQSQWEAWPENQNSSNLWPEAQNMSNLNMNNSNPQNTPENQVFHQEESPDDFFKDMVPQIRKPRKVYVRKENEVREENNTPNRLAMDPKAIIADPDLGFIDDNPSNWEDENYDPNQLIRETKKAEREKRLAEQRRKQEEEGRRKSR